MWKTLVSQISMKSLGYTATLMFPTNSPCSLMLLMLTLLHANIQRTLTKHKVQCCTGAQPFVFYLEEHGITEYSHLCEHLLTEPQQPLGIENHVSLCSITFISQLSLIFQLASLPFLTVSLPGEGGIIQSSESATHFQCINHELEMTPHNNY